MFDRLTLRYFVMIVGGYFLLWLPAYFWPGYLDTPFGIIAAIPVIAVYLFHALGVPGLLQHHGLCGWGWCAPSVFGWVFLVAFWLVLVWLVARVFAHLSGPR